MKKPILFFSIVLILILAISFYCYINYQFNTSQITQTNSKYQKYDGKSFKGTELVSIMNQIIDDNTKNNIEKDAKGQYIENETNSITADIYFKDNEKTYTLETIYNSGIENFAKNYSSQAFKCTKIEYHEKTNLVKYLHFEQI